MLKYSGVLLGTCAMLIAMVLLIRAKLDARVPFEGNGILADFGAFSYPRYRVAFEPLPLSSENQTTLRVQGLPSDRMTFGLELVRGGSGGLPQSDLEKLTSAAAEIRVKIETETAQILAEVNAPIGKWEIARSTTGELLWHTALRDLSFNQGIGYKITLKLHKAPASLQLLVRPILEGGGNELP